MSNSCGGTGQDSVLSRALAGDLDAFCDLAREHEKKLFCQALSLCRDRHLAEDLAQETLLEAWKSLDRYCSTCRFSTWLYAILMHRHQKSLRKKGRFLRLLQGATAKNSLASARLQHKAALADPADAAARREEAERLRAAVEALPIKAREVIHLRFFADATLSEISVALHIPLGTAKSRLHYALMRLRQGRQPELNHSAPSGDSQLEGRT